MLAGVRNVAFGAAIVMAGLFAVMLAERALIALFLSDAPFLFTPWSDVPQETWTYIEETLASSYTESLIGVAVMIWLVGRMVRRGLKSIAAGR
jgi:hypothetical protein